MKQDERRAQRVYAITAGEYEDYHIIATCADKTKADQICDEYNRSYTEDVAHVEEYPDRSNLDLNQHVYYVKYGNQPYAHEAHGADKIDILCEVWNKMNVISICNGKPSYVYVTANSKEEAIQRAESILEGMKVQPCK